MGVERGGMRGGRGWWGGFRRVSLGRGGGGSVSQGLDAICCWERGFGAGVVGLERGGRGAQGSNTPPLACGSCFEKSLLSFSFTPAVVRQSRQFKSGVWLKILVVFGFCDDGGCQ